jgi:hypothetical protein
MVQKLIILRRKYNFGNGNGFLRQLARISMKDKISNHVAYVVKEWVYKTSVLDGIKIKQCGMGASKEWKTTEDG